MRNSQLLVGLLFTASLASSLSSCGSSSSSANSDGSTSSGHGLICLSGSVGSCSQADLDTYNNCVFSQCGSAVTTCYGAGYQSGSFSGPCASYGGCISKCGCADSACMTACGQPSSECSTCRSNIGTCAFSSTCMIPSCLLGGGLGGTSGGAGGHVGGAGGSTGGQGGFTGGLGGSSGTSGTCAGLLACCNAATGTAQTLCMTEYNAVMSMGDASCGQILATIKPGVCP